MRRARIKVHEAEPSTAHQDEHEEPEIEYMPPREVPLPDYPDDWPHDRTYPQFEGRNLTRGWWSEFAPHRDDEDEGGDEEFSDFEEKLKLVEERERERKNEVVQQGKKSPAVKKSGLQTVTRDPLTAKGPQTLKARSAASALSGTSKPAGVPSFAAPTATSKSRVPSAVASKKPPGAIQAAAGNIRHTAAKVASNSTLGYSKGRAVSATARKPLEEVHGKQRTVAEDKNESPAKTSLDDLFMMTGGLDIGGDGDDNLGGGVSVLQEEDDALENFQLEEPMEI